MEKRRFRVNMRDLQAAGHGPLARSGIVEFGGEAAGIDWEAVPPSHQHLTVCEQRRTVALTVIHHAAGVRHLPVEGLYSSASAIGVLPVVVDPPAISTSPLGSRLRCGPSGPLPCYRGLA